MVLEQVLLYTKLFLMCWLLVFQNTAIETLTPEASGMGPETNSNPVWHCLCRKICVFIIVATVMALVLLVQGSILNYYIIKEYSTSVSAYFFFSADIFLFFTLLGALTHAYMYLSASDTRGDVSDQGRAYGYSPQHLFGRMFPTSRLGVLPLSYVSWLFYAATLVSKVLVIFTSEIPNKLLNDEVFHPGLLLGTIGASATIFILLVSVHSWAPRASLRRTYVATLCVERVYYTCLAVILLELLFPNKTRLMLTVGLKTEILCFCSLIFILPTFSVYILSLSDLIFARLSLPLDIVYHAISLCLIDIPCLVVSLDIWTSLGYIGIFIFMMLILLIVYRLSAICLFSWKLYRRHSSVEELLQTEI